MKLSNRLLLTILTSVVVGCAGPAAQHSVFQQKIQQNTQKLADDARDLMAVAQATLRAAQVKDKDPDVQRAIDTLMKSQALLGAKIDDGESFKNLTKDQLQQAVDKLYTQDQKIIELNEKLAAKDAVAVDKMTTQEVQQQAVDSYKFWQRFKLYSILSTVVLTVVVVLYYVPASPVRTFITAIGAMFASKKAVDSSTTTPVTSGKA